MDGTLCLHCHKMFLVEHEHCNSTQDILFPTAKGLRKTTHGWTTVLLYILFFGILCFFNDAVNILESVSLKVMKIGEW